MDVDAPSAFRALVASLGPELLKGPFAHDERQLVSLSSLLSRCVVSAVCALLRRCGVRR